MEKLENGTLSHWTKKVERYRRQTGLDILTALTRGNTGHRIDLLLSDGSVMYWWPDGEMRMAENLTWDIEGWKKRLLESANANPTPSTRCR